MRTRARAHTHTHTHTRPRSHVAWRSYVPVAECPLQQRARTGGVYRLPGVVPQGSGWPRIPWRTPCRHGAVVGAAAAASVPVPRERASSRAPCPLPPAAVRSPAWPGSASNAGRDDAASHRETHTLRGSGHRTFTRSWSWCRRCRVRSTCAACRFDRAVALAVCTWRCFCASSRSCSFRKLSFSIFRSSCKFTVANPAIGPNADAAFRDAANGRHAPWAGSVAGADPRLRLCALLARPGRLESGGTGGRSLVDTASTGWRRGTSTPLRTTVTTGTPPRSCVVKEGRRENARGCGWLSG